MTDSTYTHYVILVDRTGSMWNIKYDTEGGIRQYVAEQKKLPGKATLSLYQFDAWHPEQPGTGWGGEAQFTAHVDKIADFASLGQVPEYTLVPRGNTPLLHAVGTAVTETGERLAALPEDQRPGVVIFVIATDGEENWSHRLSPPSQWTKESVKGLITQQQEQYGWKFTYIGANVDAFREAGDMGIAAAAALGFRASHSGTQSAWGSATRWSAGTRSAGPGGQSVAYASSDRDDAMADDDPASKDPVKPRNPRRGQKKSK